MVYHPFSKNVRSGGRTIKDIRPHIKTLVCYPFRTLLEVGGGVGVATDIRPHKKHWCIFLFAKTVEVGWGGWGWQRILGPIKNIGVSSFLPKLLKWGGGGRVFNSL